VNSVAELEDLLRQKTWDKEIILWLDSETQLKTLLSNHKFRELDLLDLFNLNSLPTDDDDTRTRLVQALRALLQDFNATGRSRIILVVRSCGLLARYDVGLKEFYDWFCGDFSLVIIPLARPSDDTAWPESMAFEKDRLNNYFSTTGMCSRIIAEKG
jgi:hypothetical protein